MATKTKRSQKPVFEYQKAGIEATARVRKTVADAMIASKVKRKLSADQQKRASKLQEMISDLENDVHVQNRKLQTWLSEEEFAKIDHYWQQEQDHRNIYKDKPEMVQEYEEIVAKADFYFNRSEHYSLNGNHAQAHKFARMAETKFERALERLEEIVSIDPGLQIWFDREVIQSPDNDLGIDTDSVPRVVTSRSVKCRGGVSTQTIRDIKLRVVKDALRDLTYETPEGSRFKGMTDGNKLKGLLNPPDDDLI
jgi:hypothetical protein